MLDSAIRHSKQLESFFEMVKREVGLDRVGQIFPEYIVTVSGKEVPRSKQNLVI